MKWLPVQSAEDQTTAEPAENGNDDDGNQVEPEAGMDHLTDSDMTGAEYNGVRRCGDRHHESSGCAESRGE